ncbi:MAG: hypothetical protein AAFN74_23515, partial [Myxococcota bacterium]
TEPVVAREMRRRASDQLLRLGRIDDGLPLLDTILRELEMARPKAPRRALAQLIRARAAVAEPPLEWEEREPEQLDVAQVQYTDACWTAAVGLAMVNPLIAALYSSRYLQGALKLGDPNRIARALAMELSVQTAAGRPEKERLRQVLGKLRGIARRIDVPYVRGFAALAAGLAALHEGRWTETVQCCRNAKRVLAEQCSSVDWETTTTEALAVWADAYRGRFTNLRPRLESSLGYAVARDHAHGSTLLCVSPQANIVWLAEDDVTTARIRLDEAASPASVDIRLPEIWAFQSRLQLDLYRGQGVRAFRRAAMHWPRLMASRFNRAQLNRIEALYLRARAAIAAVREDASQRPLLAQARADARRLKSERPSWSRALGMLMEARIQYTLGLGGEARDLLEESEQLLEQADMAAHAAVAALRRRELDTDTPSLDRLRNLGIRDPQAWAALIAP